MEKPLLSIPAPENPNTNSDVDKTRNVKSKSESDEPTNEDYEKLAKLLQVNIGAFSFEKSEIFFSNLLAIEKESNPIPQSQPMS